MLAALLGHLALATIQAEACPAVPGQELLWANPSTRYVIFGELHGTAELPALFGDVVCGASREGPVVVGLEYPHRHQPALDAYLTSDGGPAAREALLVGMGWPANDLADGRTSVAMLDLIERLRSRKASGADLSLVAFVPRVDGAVIEAEGAIAYERAMAQRWREITSEFPGAKLLIYVGNIHASKAEMFGTRPAAMHLPAEEVLSLVEVLSGGQAWNCQGDRGDECGSHPLWDSGEAFPRGIRLTPVRDGGRIRYDGRYSPGGPATPSPPAAALAAEGR